MKGNGRKPAGNAPSVANRLKYFRLAGVTHSWMRLLAILSLLTLLAQQQPLWAAADHVMLSGHFDSERVGDRIWLDISVPASYDKSDSKTYPVVYMTDGYWRREVHKEIHRLGASGELEQLILVGIGYPNGSNFIKKRNRDLVTDVDDFIACIQEEVMPQVENRFRVDTSRRCLFGASFGGYFVLYSMLERENFGKLFGNYICGSPAVTPRISHASLFQKEKSLRKAGAKLAANLYIAVGQREPEDFKAGFTKMVRRLRKSAREGLRMEDEILPGHTHETAAEPALINGLKLFYGLE